MVKAKKCGVNVPTIIKVDLESRSIMMTYINGLKLKDYIN